MKSLSVFVSSGADDLLHMTLPVDIYASDGSMLATGTASHELPGRFDLPDQVDCVYVVGKLPNGLSIQKTVEFNGNDEKAFLNVGNESPHEWLRWATPFRSLGHLRDINASNRRIGNVWMTLWSLRDGSWEAVRVQPSETVSDNGMKQLTLDVPDYPHLLQIGGEEVAWRLISLPPGGRVRVALTRSASERGDALDITIGRIQPDNELIMSYLTRGAVAEAGRLIEICNVADLSLYKKREDPVSAAAGAYILLKSRRLELRHDWLSNLVNWFPYMADGTIVSAAFSLQQDNIKESEIRSLIDKALSRGLPIFSMGASLLVETMAAIHRGKQEKKRFHQTYLAAQAYQRANCSKGAYFAFFGKSPAEPSWIPIYGSQGEARAVPASYTDKANVVVYARPIKSNKMGQYGNTRVALPRASVSPGVVDELRDRSLSLGRETGATELTNRPQSKRPRLFKKFVHLGVPALETNFLEEFVRPNNQSQEFAAVVPFQLASRQAPVAEVKKDTENRKRRTAKYWQNERRDHAITIFDADE